MTRRPTDPRFPTPSGKGLRALFVNATLKHPDQRSHTDGLLDVADAVMQHAGVDVHRVRLTSLALPPGVVADGIDRGWERDDWPLLWHKVQEAHILVVGSPIWLGSPSSVCSRFLERLYAMSGHTNDHGQYVFYGKVGGCVVTGNEDGVKAVSKQVLYALQHVGYTIPPQADAGWIGEAGPGASYLDEGSGGPSNDFTQRNTTFMAWNLIHAANLLEAMGGYPAWGNVPSRWAEGERFGHPGLPQEA